MTNKPLDIVPHPSSPRREFLIEQVALLAGSVQQLQGGHQALGAQLTRVAGQLGSAPGPAGKPNYDRLAFCANCKEVTRTTPTKAPVSPGSFFVF